MHFVALFKKFAHDYKKYIICGPLMKIVEVVFDILTPLIIAWMVDAGINTGNVQCIFLGGAALVLMCVCGFGFTLVCQKMASLTSQGMGCKIRTAIYEKVASFSFTELNKFPASTLVTRTINDVNQMQLAIAMLIRQVIRWPILAVGSVVAALLIDMKLGIVLCVCLPIITLIFYIVMKASVPLFLKIQSLLDKLSLLVREQMTGVRFIRASVKEVDTYMRFADASSEQSKVATRAGKFSATLSPATFLVLNLGICVILYQGGYLVNVGELTQGQIMAFIGYMSQLLISITYVANLVLIFTRAGASASRINEVLDAPVVQSTVSPNVDKQATDSLLKVTNLSYSFASDAAYVLDDISFELKKGQTFGIIGPTGSGKSTLANIIAKNYEIQKGSIIFDECDLQKCSIDKLHNSISMVPQTSELESGTVRSNLCWRNTSATDCEIMRALEVAQARGFVNDLDADVAVMGKNFSGGQRQRLCIARAILPESNGDMPKLLIFDDSTSALDAKTDANLRGELRKYLIDTSIIIISQRISSVNDCDNILVLDAGRAVGYGNHSELLKSCNTYRELAMSQQEEALQ